MLLVLAGINWPQLLLKVMLTSAVVFVAFGSCALILIFIKKLSRMDFSRKHRIRLTNGGNVHSYYRLQVAATEPRLQFRLIMDGIPLADIPVEKIDSLAPLPLEAVTIPKNQPAPAKNTQGGESGKNAGSAVTGASQAGKSVAEKSGVLASLLGTFGSLLPGKVGATLKQQGEAARNVQTKTVKTMQMPETAKNKVDAIQRDSNKLGVASSAAAPQNASNEKRTADRPEAVQKNNRQVVAVDTNNISDTIIRSNDCFVQTKEVKPGESLDLTLAITPVGRHSPSGSFVYIIKSQQVPLEKLDQEAPEITSRGMVYFTPVATWRYWLPSILNGMILLIELLGVAYFTTLIWL